MPGIHTAPFLQGFSSHTDGSSVIKYDRTQLLIAELEALALLFGVLLSSLCRQEVSYLLLFFIGSCVVHSYWSFVAAHYECCFRVRPCFMSWCVW